MLNNSIEEIRAERAKFAQGVEYLKETALDDAIDERMEVVESEYGEVEKMEELREAKDMLDKVSTDNELIEESTELDKLLDSEDDLTFEEMVGIE